MHDLFKVYYGHIEAMYISNVISPGKRHVKPGNGMFNAQRKFEEYCQGYHERLEQASRFYSRLAKDILQNGIQNPILVHAGYCSEIYKKYLPKGDATPNSEILCTDRNGGSRLWVAQNFNMVIPIIVGDFVGMFENDSRFEELKTIEDIKNKYRDSDKVIVQIGNNGVNIGSLPNPYHEKETK